MTQEDFELMHISAWNAFETALRTWECLRSRLISLQES